MQAIVSKKVPLYYFLLFIIVGFIIVFSNERVVRSGVSKPLFERAQSSGLEILRNKGNKLTQPLLSVDMKGEDDSFKSLKATLSQFQQQKIASGAIKTASIYFNDLNTGKYFTINPSEQYCPGSIIKIAVMMTYLKEAEINQSILDKQIFFDSHFSGIPEQHLYGTPLIEKRSYAVKDLISKMIVESDNDAAALLTMNLNRGIFVDLFKTLSLPKPDLTNWEYFLSVEECSRFLKVLFNATYLNDENSEYAIKLLTKTMFDIGMQKYIDNSILLAHKFGERRLNSNTEEQQLHESGIVYFRDQPYLLTIMTKGNSNVPLPEVLAQVSKIILDEQKRKAL